MATVTLQRVRPFQEVQNGVLIGPVTNNLYTVNGLGQVTIDTLDQANLLTQGWLPSGAQGPTGPPGPTGPTGPAGGGGGSTTGTSIDVVGTDQNVTPGTGSALTGRVSAEYATIVSDPGFTNIGAFNVSMLQRVGFDNYGTVGAAAFTQNKCTPIVSGISGTFIGSGEHFVFTLNGTFYGMSDSFLFSGGMTYATGPIAGDEGQGFSPQFYCDQQKNLVVATIASVVRATYSTTITAGVTGSKTAQDIHVASTVGAVVGDWIVFNQKPPDQFNLICASRIESIGAGTIHCVCMLNLPSGTTITPAMVLGIADYQMGQDRVLVNLTSGVSYSAGHVSQTPSPSAAILGYGTTWTAGMVGGNANNIGAISFDDDTYNQVPFNHGYDLSVTSGSGPTRVYGNFTNTSSFRSWYQITAVSSNTGIGVHAMSVAAIGYNGRLANAYPPPAGWPAPAEGTAGGYVIKPAARVLLVSPPGFGNTVICETTTSVWNPGDLVECVICPYPDLHGFDIRMGQWNPGGIRRHFVSLMNSGAREIDIGLVIGMGGGSTFGSPGCDIYPYNHVLDVTGKVGLNVTLIGNTGGVTDDKLAAVRVTEIGSNANTDAGSRIYWASGVGDFWLGKSFANVGLSGRMCLSQLNRPLDFVRDLNGASSTPANNLYKLPKMEWPGYIRLTGDDARKDAFIELGGLTYTADRLQLATTLASGTGPNGGVGYSGQPAGGLDIVFLTGSGTGTPTPLFSVGTYSSWLVPSPFVALPPPSPATSGANHNSVALAIAASVWNSSAASVFRPAILTMVPGSGVDPTCTLNYQFFDHDRVSEGDKFAFPITAFSITDRGKVTFGYNNSFSSFGGVTMDPVQTTAPRTVTWPDVSGGNAVVVPSGGSPASSTAAGTAGQVHQDGTSVYICYATGTSAANRWVKVAGTFTF